jgi:hypothetical protein
MKAEKRISPIRLLLFGEAVVLLLAALIHTGALIDGYQHRKARIAENVMAGVLAMGFILSWVRPSWTKITGIVAQGFALVGTLIGMLTIIVGIGPRTTLDILYHLGLVGLLSWGLLYAIRTPTGRSEDAEPSWFHRAHIGDDARDDI